jgi:hypothetical protein
VALEAVERERRQRRRKHGRLTHVVYTQAKPPPGRLLTVL